jgi:hypothetical protein
MVNKTMQGKAMKAQRQRRAWAKPFSQRSPILGPNRGVLQQYKESAAGLGVPDYEVDGWIKRLYGREPFKGTPHGRAEVLQLIEQLKLHVPQDRFVEILDNCYQRALLWFNATHSEWIITHTDKRRCMFRRSIVYPDKSVAMAWYSRGKVTWILTESTVPIQSG